MRRLLYVAWILVIIALPGAGVPLCAAQDQGKEVIRVKGSESPAWMVDAYAAEFMKKVPRASIMVSGGQGIGWPALLNKECEVAMSSRVISDVEKQGALKKGLAVQERLIGWGGIVIIVHPNNPVNELTVEQVRKIFAGDYFDWSQVGGPKIGISVFTIGEQRLGTLDFMREHFLKSSFASKSVTKTFFRSVIASVSEDGNATSFVRVRNILQLKQKGEDARVKIVAIKKDEQSAAVLPSRETVDNGTYPITRPYYLYFDPKTAGKLVEEFVEFCAAKNPRGM